MKSWKKQFYKIKRRFRVFFHQYINGTKGVISLFLVFIMLPFLSIALLLVESARYQHAYELVNEIMDSAGLSAEADFDPYLDERFGLIATTQERNPADNYKKYLELNAATLSNSITMKSVSAKGRFPLSDKEVFVQQALEFSEISAGIKAGEDFLQVDKFLKELYKKFNLADFNKLVNNTDKLAKAAKSAAKVLEAVKKYLDDYPKYQSDRNSYESNCDSFYYKADDLVDKLNEARDALAEDEDESAIYTKQPVIDAISECNSARDNFKDSAAACSTSITKLRDDIKGIYKALSTMSKDMVGSHISLEHDYGTLSEQCTTTDGEFVAYVYDQILTTMGQIAEQESFEDDINEISQKYDEQKGDLASVVCTEPPAERDGDKYYIDIDTNVDGSGFSSRFDEINDMMDNVNLSNSGSLNNVFDKLAQKSDLSEQKGKLLDLLDVVTAMLNVKLIYDGSLDAAVLSEYSDESVTSFFIITSITKVCDAGRNFINSTTETNPIKRVIKLVKALGDFITGISCFFASVVTWIGTFAWNIGMLVAGKSDLYEIFFLGLYGMYNCPSRTTYTDSGISGYSYSKLFSKAGGNSTNGFSGALDDLSSIGTGSGGDKAFRGGEVEYLLQGSCNELSNQAATFINLYLMRLVLDIIPIFRDPLVKSEAAAATIAGWVVYLIIILVEPFIDVLVLVNGGDAYFQKETIYFTPPGALELAQFFVENAGIGAGSKQAAKDALQNHFGKVEGDGLYEMDYNQHVLVLMLMSVSEDHLIKRLQNLVTMESRLYKNDFELSKAYTGIEGSASYNLNSMFKIDKLSGPYNVSQTRFVAY